MSGFPRRLRYPAGERPYGEVGRVVKVRVNAFEIESLPSKPFHIYDVIIAGTTELTGRHENADAKRLNVRRASEIIDRLQTRIEPATFNPRAAYDGNKLLYSTTNLGGSRKFEVNMSDQRHADPNSKKGVFTVKLTLARKFEPRQWINQLITSRSTDNDQEHIAAVNFLQVLLRQVPMHHTLGKAYNARSVFTSHASREVKDLPLDLWRGYFQYVCYFSPM
ncbi:hypothetical protein OF83DRAFT_569843 [Amylostereum chailletii]|nr:hypothetical protein OF83DRAFT_569843 [Amylostereum chailletii]